MNRFLILGALIGGLLLPGLTFAADGDECVDSDNNRITLGSRGNWTVIACVQLCDTKVAADSTCTEYDFNSGPGMPDMLIFEYEENPDLAACTSTADFTLTTGPVSRVALANAPKYDIDTSAVVLSEAGTNRLTLVTAGAPLDRFLFTDILDDANCTDVDIRMFFYNRKTGMF